MQAKVLNNKTRQVRLTYVGSVLLVRWFVILGHSKVRDNSGTYGAAMGQQRCPFVWHFKFPGVEIVFINTDFGICAFENGLIDARNGQLHGGFSV